MIKPRTLDDLNPVLVQNKPEWVKGVLDACNFINDTYAKTSSHPKLIGDCVLAKLNLLKRNKRIRATPVRILERRSDYT